MVDITSVNLLGCVLRFSTVCGVCYALLQLAEQISNSVPA